ncbi:hypothetical protein P7K49_008461 [Saguinus oedipus]|uniref:Uncharacterized protein n=1 Tax=Saguinus oedipus TaxID=9490 RepID=A0ABQ9VYJ3_SAGOE|nr:hypothetical protein P7K49_008461 [Saguinus oedipus]
MGSRHFELIFDHVGHYGREGSVSFRCGGVLARCSRSENISTPSFPPRNAGPELGLSPRTGSGNWQVSRGAGLAPGAPVAGQPMLEPPSPSPEGPDRTRRGCLCLAAGFSNPPPLP